MEKQRFFLVRGRGQMVELFCLVAVGIHDKRHSAPRNLKFLVTEVGGGGGSPQTSLSLQQEEDEPEPLVMWPVAGASCQGDMSEI